MISTSLQNELNRADKSKIENCLMVGRLAEDGPIIPNALGKEPGRAVSVFAQFEERIIFFIEPLSDDPELLNELLGVENRDVYISFDKNNQRYLDRYNYSKQENPVEFIREHFKNKLILFKPVLNYDKKKERYHYNFQIILDEEVKNQDELSQQYEPIPIMSSSLTTGRFERQLMDQKPIQLKNYNHALTIPHFIACDDYLYLINDEEVLNKYQSNDNVYICREPQKVKRISIPDDFDQNMKVYHQDVAFFPKEKVMKEWKEEAEKNGVEITNIEEHKEEKPLTGEKSETKNDRKKEEAKPKSTETSDFYVEENDFLLRLDYHARKKKLRYSLDDLYNFHTSLKTSNFTILGGMSGTGKTELARLYAKALKMEEGDNLLYIPVQPSYTEPSDLLGFLNQQTGVYLESEVGLVSFLYKASQEKDKMHMVLFDEMNLGQVEHYFSDFISVLELEGKDKRLRLFNENTNCFQEHLKNGIPILDNVLFVGTANFDETTRDFSNRMLDRSNVIILEKQSFVEAHKYEAEDINDLSDYENQEKNNIKKPDQEIKATNYNDWIVGKKELSSLEQHELVILDDLHQEISNYDSQTGVSFRIAKQIGHYLTNIPKDESGNLLLSRPTGFDYQIKQRILSKIRGHKEQIGELVGEYDKNNKFTNGRIGIILSESEKVKCTKSIEYLEQKAKELMRNGYTL